MLEIPVDESETIQTEAAKPALSSLERAVNLIRVISDAPAPGIGVTSAAQRAGLPKAASHRILKSLCALQIASFDNDSKLYTLGPDALAIGLAALRQLDVPRLARPYLSALVDQTSETATLSMLQGSRRIYLDQILSPQEIKMTVRIGESFPLHAGASSKAIMSAFSGDELNEYLASITLSPLTEFTITDPDAFRHELEDIRVLGYASSRGERQPDAASVAAPVLRADGTVFGALSVCGPVQRFDRAGISAIGRLVREVALQLSHEIGYKSPPGSASHS
jgi:DNA-binding IclR family transcriptional regulator